MKKLIPVLLALCLLLAPMTGNVSADGHEQTLPGTEQTPVDPAGGMARELGQMEEYQPGSVPADGAQLDAIGLPIHALVLSMVEQDMVYDGQSDIFIWNALYYMLSLYGQTDSRCEVTDSALILPSETVQDYFFSLFSGRTALPAIPGALADRVSYDPAQNCYRLSLGDFGLAQTQLTGLRQLPGNSCLADGTLVALEDGSTLCRFQVTLAENDTMFGFSILDLVIL